MLGVFFGYSDIFIIGYFFRIFEVIGGIIVVFFRMLKFEVVD